MSDFLPFSRPAMGAEELAAVKAVLDSGWITTGPKNQQLEEAFCQLTGNQHAVAVCSATAGMHITLMALGIGAGDEVITPSMTWVSTLNMIVLLGATPQTWARRSTCRFHADPVRWSAICIQPMSFFFFFRDMCGKSKA